MATIHPDKQLLAVADRDNVLRAFDIPTGQQIGSDIDLQANRIITVAFSPDGAQLAAGTADGTVELCDLESGGRRAVRWHDEAICAVAFSPDGRLIATGSEDDQARIWEAEHGNLADQLVGHAGYVQAIAFSPDGLTVATGGADQSVRLWSRRPGGSRHRLTGHSNAVLALAFHPEAPCSLREAPTKRYACGTLSPANRLVSHFPERAGSPP